MAVRKTAKKQTKKASLNVSLDVDKKTTNKLNKQIKNTPAKTLILSVVVLLVFALIGGAVTYFLTKNDCFVLLGEEEITITLDERYTDEGVKIVAFNKDVSGEAKISTNLQVENNQYFAEEVGTYYIEYTVDNIKYNTLFKIKKVRLITVVEPSEGENIPSEATNG